MATKIKKPLAGIAALAALALGGAAIAQAGGQDQKATSPPVSERTESTAPENSATDPDNIQFEGKGENEKGEKADNEKGEKAESGERDEANESANEKGESEPEGAEVPGDDGPGGHADEPANPNANHQFEGQE